MLAIIGCVWIASICVGAAAVVVSAASLGVSVVQGQEAEEQAKEMQDLNEEAMADQKKDAEANRALKNGLQLANEKRMTAAVGSSIAIDQIATKRTKIKAGNKRRALASSSTTKRAVRTQRPEYNNGKTSAA